MKTILTVLLLAASAGCHVHTHSGHGHGYGYAPPRNVKVYYATPQSYVTCTNLSHEQCYQRVNTARDRQRFHNRSYYHRPRPRPYHQKVWHKDKRWGPFRAHAHAGVSVR